MKQTPRAGLGNAIGAVLALMTGGVAVAFAAVAFGLGGHGLFHQGLNPIFPNAGGSELHLPAAGEAESSAGSTSSNPGPDQGLGNRARPTGTVAEALDAQSATFEPDTAPQEGGVEPNGQVIVDIDGPVPERPGSGGGDEPPAAPNDPGETPAGDDGRSDDTTRDGASNDPTKDESEDDGKSKPAKERPGADEPRQTEDGEGDDDSASNGASTNSGNGSGNGNNSGHGGSGNTGGSSAAGGGSGAGGTSDDKRPGTKPDDDQADDADDDSDGGTGGEPDDGAQKPVSADEVPVEPAGAPDAADGSTVGPVAPVEAAPAAADASGAAADAAGATASDATGTSAADAGFGS